MNPETLKLLEGANLPPAQARAIVEAIEGEVVDHKSTLATKTDLLEMRVELAEFRGAMRLEFSEFQTSMRAEFAEFQASMRAEFADFRRSIELDSAKLRAEMIERIESAKGDLARWVLLVILGQSAAMLGIGYFLLNQIKR